MNLMPVKAEFFLRRAHHEQPRTMIAGLLHSIEVPQNPNECQLIMGSLIIVPQRRFILPDEYGGWKIGDLLEQSWDVSQMKELPL